MLKYEMEMLVLYPLLFSFISSNICPYCQDLEESLFIHYFFFHFFFFRWIHTHMFCTVLYESFWKKTAYAKLPSSFPHHFLNKSARPLDMSYKHKIIITRTFLLTLDLCDNKDLLWFYLWNPLDLNENFFFFFLPVLNFNEEYSECHGHVKYLWNPLSSLSTF